MGYSARQLHDLWLQANPQSSGYVAWEAAAVALAESGGNPNASNTNTNGTIDRGLWQINSIHGDLSTFDPIRNAQAAYTISGGGHNWRPWCTAWGDGACGTKGGKYGDVTSPAWKIELSSWFQKQSKGTSGGPAKTPGDVPIIGPVLGALPSSSPLSWAEGLAKLAANLLDARFWLRIGQGLAAVLLLLIGGGLVFRRDAMAAAKIGALV